MTWITETRHIGRGVTATKRSWLGPLMGEMTMETPRGEAVILHIALSRGDPPMSVCTGEHFMLPSQNDKRPRVLCEPCRLKILHSEQ